MAGAVHFLRGDFAAVDAAPRVEDVGQDEGNEQGDVGHDPEREQAGAAVGQGEGALQVAGGGVVGRIVIARHQQKGQDGEHGART